MRWPAGTARGEKEGPCLTPWPSLEKEKSSEGQSMGAEYPKSECCTEGRKAQDRPESSLFPVYFLPNKK